jgi:predicted TIM-barrel fold metal-dependent hydrolase
MYKGFKVLDSDSHMMEPDEIWDKYLEPKYRSYAPGGSKRVTTRRADLSKEGFARRLLEDVPEPAYINDGEGGLLTYEEAYAPYMERGFDAESFLMYMDKTGIDHMVLYPTAALGLTAGRTAGQRQVMNPKVAAALEQAYNNWVYDFCDGGKGRLSGAGGVDLRDAEAAALEARRCVTELGMKAIYILPQPALGIPLHDEYYDVLWATMAELGVPMGIHGLQSSSSVGTDYWGSSFSMGRATTSFPFEEMMACVSMTAGGVLERHPDMRVVFLESGAGWAPYWLWWCDDKWKQHAVTRDTDTKELPSFYFKRQCYISGEPEEPGIQFCVQNGLEDNLVIGTDFPHPEDINFPRAMEDFFDGQGEVLTQEQIRKILWDNPAKLYGVS